MSVETVFGSGFAYRLPEVRPQDDLFRHVNGRWLDEVSIPADRASAGAMIDQRDAAERHLREIAEQAAASGAPAGSDERKIGDLYTCFLDEKLAERLGGEPLRPSLALIEGITSVSSLCRVMGQLQRQGVPTAFRAFITTDDRRSDRYVVYLDQGGLGLPDESYYREDGHAGAREGYRAHMRTMLGLAGLPDPGGTADRVIALESRLASAHWDVVSTRDAVRCYTLMTRAELDELAPGVDWDAWMSGLRAPAGALAESVIRQPDFFRALSAALASVPLADWRDWLAWHLIRTLAPLLSRSFADEHFAFYGTALTGAPEQRERWKRGLSIIDSALGEALGRLYVERHFPPRSKEIMLKLVGNLVEAHRQLIETLPWMSQETKTRALAKLASFMPKIGYPDRWRDYSAVEISRDDLAGNVLRANAAEYDWYLAKLGRPVDRGEWYMTPQTVNAYYNPGMNEIVFTAAILQPPFFDPDADPAINYGGIGAVIGHEIGHGFDDQGSKYNGAGTLEDWWTSADRSAFDQRAAALIAQFDALELAQVPGRRVNGALTVGENIGDLGGVAMAYKAYLLSLGEDEPPVIDGLTGPQRFFMSWARIWCGKARDAEMIRRLTIDPHSPGEFRCNAILRNLDEFHEAFGVSDGDGLWLAPEARVRIW
jgi:putative endopeptidase